MAHFYVSLIASSFIFLSAANSSTVLDEAKTAATSSTSISATTSHVTPKDDLTSFTDRLKVVREYYGEKPFNKDPTIFTHIAKWHDQDVKAISSRLTSEENRAKLSEFSTVMDQTFDRGEANFAKVSAAYLLYSRVLSRDIEPCTDSDVLDYHAKQNQSVLRYIQDGSLDGFYNDWVSGRTGNLLWISMWSYGLSISRSVSENPKSKVYDQFKTDSFFDLFKKILLLSQMGVRSLPVVSETALASYEELNDSFALWTPLLGMPLKRGDYDGNFNQLPEMVFGHDLVHSLFNAEISHEYVMLESVAQKYTLYRQFNNAIGQAQEHKRRFLSHFFLFKIGHELGFFDPKNQLAAQGCAIDRTTTQRIFQDYIDSTIQNIEVMTEGKPFASLWAYPQGCTKLVNGESVPQPMDEDYFRNHSFWRYMVDESTGNLCSPEEMFVRFDLDRSSYLRGIDVISAINKKLGLNLTLTQENDGIFFERGMNAWLNAYNTLIENQTYFQQNGLTDFQVWKGDKINVEGIKVQLQKAVDVFQEDVLPKL